MKAEIFQGTVSKYMQIRHIRTRENLRAHTTCGSSTTFRKYWNDPDLMPMGIWLQIMDSLNVPYEERWEILKK